MFKDFREYLDYIEKQKKLQRITKEVDVRYEIAAGIRKTSDIDGPALLFENIKGYPGWKVVGGLYATQNLIALALGLPQEADEERITQCYVEYQQKRVKPVLVSTGAVKEIIIKGEDVDLRKLPVCTYSEKDVGPYLTAGVEIARHPDTGIQNVAIHRRKILGKDRTSLLAGPLQHLGRMIATAERKGEGLGVATALGVEPSLAIASQIKAPEGIDESEIAGAIRGAPLEMVKCETIDVDVPANAEIVIEGVTIPNERVNCGPFGEVPGNYITLTGAPQTPVWVVKVTTITMRRNAIFHAVLTGMPMTENHAMRKWACTAKAYQEASQIAEVKAVNATAGSAGYHYIVSIRKMHEMEPRTLMYTLFGAPISARRITVVDDDINVYDLNEVEWAVVTRVLAHKDILIVPPVNRGLGEPSLAEQISARWGIDATMPLKDKQWYERVTVPGVNRVDYI